MSLKTGFATVLKAMRVSRGLTQKHMADSTSRTYMSKLEQGRSRVCLKSQPASISRYRPV